MSTELTPNDKVDDVAKERHSDKARAPETQAAKRSSSVQLKRSLNGLPYDQQAARLAVPGSLGAGPQQHVQAKEDDAVSGVHAAAAHGVSGSGGTLPHLRAIQQAFGTHDVSSVAAHVGGKAAEANIAMGARAYATGNDVAFSEAPSLHTAAHEAAHIVQQRAGVSLEGGVGQAGDSYEAHADRVADAVVAGQSAEPLLNEMAGTASGSSGARAEKQEVQREEAVSGGTETPAPVTEQPVLRDVRVAAESEPLAKHKIADIDAEGAPNCAGLKAPFFAAVTQRLTDNPALGALDGMREEVRSKESTYILQGNVLPAGQIAAAQGLTRILDLPSLYNFNYLTAAKKAMYGHPDDFVRDAANGNFNPDTELNNDMPLRGQVAETWWAPAGPTAGMNLAEMITAFHLVGDTNYEKGVVRLTLTPEGINTMGLEAHKPTAFDGLMQGWGEDPWWVASDDPHWGLTKHGTKEILLGAAKLSCFPNRELTLPAKAPEMTPETPSNDEVGQ